MHILATTSATLDDLAEPVDLGQSPAEMVALSFTDSDLASLAAAWGAEPGLPEMRLARLADLRHPMSVDLWIDRVAAHAKVILVRILGGYDWWRYGCDRLSALARERGIRLALLPGECREADAELERRSTLPKDELDALLGYFREGGPENMQALVRRLAGREAEAARPVPKAGYYGAVGEGSVVPILFYRSMLLAGDVAPIDALAAALAECGMRAAPVYVQSLKDGESLAFLERAFAELRPRLVVTTTAFASDGSIFDRLGVPVLQAIVATTRQEAWRTNQRGLAPADLAMHVVMPELDGRILAGAIAFKAEAEHDAAFGFAGMGNRPMPDRVAAVAARVAAYLTLQETPRAERRLAVLMPDYPAAAGRTGYAVGLDVPESVRVILQDLKGAGYRVDGIPETARALLDRLSPTSAVIPAKAGIHSTAWCDGRVDPRLRGDDGGGWLGVEVYRQRLAEVPAAARDVLHATWGDPADDPDVAAGAFRFRAATFGNVTVALAPDRGRSADRRAEYHDPTVPPRHALVAFGFWLRDRHALVHVGAHGTLEWLPGKAVALSESCFPEIVTGPLPVVYPFIVSNPGEAAQAKRRIAAVTLGHLPPPLVSAGLDEDKQALERLVDEYAQADGLDRRRRDRLARLIVETAARTGLAGEAGVSVGDDPDAALMRIDAWLCDLKDFAIKDGLHVYGRAAPDEADPLRVASAEAERAALLAALDGRHVTAGPAGAPARGRRDVLPTGRNLYTADPRAMPTPTAVDLARLAADEVVRRYLQDHGDWPRALVMDLWGSASLRTGGEEIAQGLALMGCRPQWDGATGRVTGIEVLPPAAMGRPRVDVTWRISGLFRDLFPTQIALIDAAVGAVAVRDEAAEENPLAEAARGAGAVPARIFGSSPGTYGSGVEELLQSGAWQDRGELGAAYLAATSHAYGGAEGEGRDAGTAFADRVAGADLIVHAGNDPGRDILEGSADVAFIGGFAAAVAALNGRADLIALDTTDPARPRARSVAEAVARTVRARAVNPRFIAGQMRHGPRGAAEFAETVDRLVGFAETTEAIPGVLIEAVFDAYLGDAAVRDFMARENPEALAAIARRFADARRRGLWHPLRNSVDEELTALTGTTRGEAA
jgi:cobaltochelatase CobN